MQRNSKVYKSLKTTLEIILYNNAEDGIIKIKLMHAH